MKELENLELESWKDLIEFPEYQISSLGRVKNKINGKINKGSINQAGYLLHRFYYYDTEGNRHTKDIRTHLLVAKYFVVNGDPSYHTYVHHLDGNKLNAQASNLKWVSKEDLLSQDKNISKKRSTGKPVCEYDLKGNLIRIWCSATAVSKIYPIAARTIHDPCMRKTKTAYGRQWRYYEDCKGIKISSVDLKPYDLNLLNQKIRSNLYNYKIEVPQEYLYQEDLEVDHTKNLETLIKHSPLTSLQRNTLRDAQNYILQLEDIICQLSSLSTQESLSKDIQQVIEHITNKNKHL